MSSVDQATQDKILEARTLRGRPPTQRMVPYRSVRHMLENRASESPDKVYLIHYDADGNREKFTYGEFNAKVNQAVYLLKDLGVQRGDRIATIGYNHSDLVLIYFAAWKLGAAVAPQNVAEDDKRIAFILRNSEAVVVFAREEYLERAEMVVHSSEEELGADNVREIVQIEGTPHDGYRHMHNSLKNYPTTLDFADETTLDDESLLVYTSGTTGTPKGVVLLQYNMLVDAYAISAWQGITGNQRMMCVLPIHHVNGTIVTLITPMFVGGSTVLNRGYSPRHFWERIVKERVHVVSVVPTLLQFSIEYGESQMEKGNSKFGDGIAAEDLDHFRHIVCGAGTLAVGLATRFEEMFEIPILHGYGLSESTCYSCFLPIDLDWETHRHWMKEYGYPSIGCQITSNQMAIFDPEGSGQQLGPGERGEICIQGHNIMKYYFKRPDANTETFKFGWFRSGDEGFYEEDEQGRQFFFITGRIKELINRGGVKFSPLDIEETLLEIPGVKVGLAIGFENDYYGEEIGAYIVPEKGADVTAEQVLDYCREQMTFEKSPKVVVFGTDIPVTSTGKYQRLKLHHLFTEWKSTQFRK
jgi:long-chain acyl-CoA synthetase